MRRRDFIALLGSAAAWPLAARAQPADRMRRIGVLMVLSENDPQSRSRVAAFQQGLDKLGWTVGRNLAIDYRWGVSNPERARTAAAELLGLAPDLILANATLALIGAQQATRTVPIVFTGVSEPVSQGFVASLARPGGNTTGFTNLEPSVAGKWVELLKEMAPRVTRVALVFNPASTPIPAQFVRAAEAGAAKLGLETAAAQVGGLAEIEATLSRLAGEPGIGLIFPPDTFTGFHHKLIVELTARHRLPAIYSFGYFPAAGGLVSYGPDVTDHFRRSAVYVDRIFRGEGARRSAGAAADQVRVRDQPQDGQGARPDRAGQAHRRRRRGDRMSNLLLAQADCGCHAALSRSIALRVVIIFRMTATMMTLDFLLASARRLEKALRAGLCRLALRAAM